MSPVLPSAITDCNPVTVAADRAEIIGRGSVQAVAAMSTIEPLTDALRTGLESCGLAVSDTMILLERFAAGAAPHELSRDIALGSLLRKRSAKGREHMLAAVRRRYLEARPPLPGVGELTAALGHTSAAAARAQILLPYLLLSDRAAWEIVVSEVLPRLVAGEALSKQQVMDRLDRVLGRHGRKRWGDALRRRWAEGLLSVLREVEALGRGRNREVLLPYAPRPEAFAFHLWGLYTHELRGPLLYRSPFWMSMLLRDDEPRRLIGVVAGRGWWKLGSVGGTDEIVPAHGSLMEWLRVGMG